MADPDPQLTNPTKTMDATDPELAASTAPIAEATADTTPAPPITKGPDAANPKEAIEDLQFRLHELEYEHFYRRHRTEMIGSVYRFRLIYAIGGLILGTICMLAGTVLFLFGVVGSTSWTANILGAESKITDAAPGAILFIVGLFVVLLTRFSHRINTSTGSRYEG